MVDGVPSIPHATVDKTLSSNRLHLFHQEAAQLLVSMLSTAPALATELAELLDALGKSAAHSSAFFFSFKLSGNISMSVMSKPKTLSTGSALQ